MPLSIEVLKPKIKNSLSVSSAFKDGSVIPEIYSAYDQNVSMPLNWSKGPEQTQSYAILMEDPDAHGEPLPFAHWVAWNIPAEVTALQEGLPANGQLQDPQGMKQGANTKGEIGYMGPRPPKGDLAHKYHIQVFAVDRKLDLPIGADRDDVLEALKGHVLSMGELKGNFKRPEHPTKP